MARTAVSDSEQLEIEVRAYPAGDQAAPLPLQSDQCAASPRLNHGDSAPKGLIPKSILGISVWVTVLDGQVSAVPAHVPAAGGTAQAHGPDLAHRHGHRRYTAYWHRFFVNVAEFSDRSQPIQVSTEHADETRWPLVEAEQSEVACQRWYTVTARRAPEVVVFTLDPTRSAAGAEAACSRPLTGCVVSVDRFSIVQSVDQ